MSLTSWPKSILPRAPATSTTSTMGRTMEMIVRGLRSRRESGIGALLDILVDARVVGRGRLGQLRGRDGSHVRLERLRQQRRVAVLLGWSRRRVVRSTGVALVVGMPGDGHGGPAKAGEPGTIRRLPRARCTSLATGVHRRTRYEPRPGHQLCARQERRAAPPRARPHRAGRCRRRPAPCSAVRVGGRHARQPAPVGERRRRGVGGAVGAGVVHLDVVDHGRQPSRPSGTAPAWLPPEDRKRSKGCGRPTSAALLVDGGGRLGRRQARRHGAARGTGR